MFETLIISDNGLPLLTKDREHFSDFPFYLDPLPPRLLVFRLSVEHSSPLPLTLFETGEYVIEKKGKLPLHFDDEEPPHYRQLIKDLYRFM